MLYLIPHNWKVCWRSLTEFLRLTAWSDSFHISRSGLYGSSCNKRILLELRLSRSGSTYILDALTWRQETCGEERDPVCDIKFLCRTKCIILWYNHDVYLTVLLCSLLYWPSGTVISQHWLTFHPCLLIRYLYKLPDLGRFGSAKLDLSSPNLGASMDL